MTFYLARAKMTKHAMKALVDRPEDRLVKLTRFLQNVGGRLHNYFFALGEDDIVLIYELPDNTSALSLGMILSASGSVESLETTVLLTMDEAVEAMRQASEPLGVYPVLGSDKRT